MKNLLLLLLLTSIFSCTSQNCERATNNFSTYKEAISVIDNTSFNMTDEVNTSKSSWIRKAHFYSCDKLTGYLTIKTDKKRYVFDAVPIDVWKSFKRADSFGEFYNKNIRGKYKLYVN